MRNILSVFLTFMILLLLNPLPYSFTATTLSLSPRDESGANPTTRYAPAPQREFVGNLSRQESSISTAEWLPKIMFYRTYGGYSDDSACSIAKTLDEGFAVAGSTSSFGAGQYDFWLVKTNKFGELQWSKTYGGSGDEYAYAMVQTSDGGFALVGGTKPFGVEAFDVWLVKTDALGNEQWSRTFGGVREDWGYSLVATSDGGLAIAGWTASFGQGSGDFWLIKTNVLGIEEWNRTYGGIYSEAAFAIQQTRDEGFALCGYTYSYGNGGSDAYLVRTDRLGNLLWNRTYGGGGNDFGNSLLLSSDGSFAIAGSTSSSGSGGYDFWLIRTNSQGLETWNKTYGGADDDEARSVQQTGDSGFALAGWTYSFGKGRSDVWIVRTDAFGNQNWDISWGGSNNDYGYSIVLSGWGYMVYGKTSSFGAGSYDSLLVVVSPEPIERAGGTGGGIYRVK